MDKVLRRQVRSAQSSLYVQQVRVRLIDVPPMIRLSCILSVLATASHAARPDPSTDPGEDGPLEKTLNRMRDKVDNFEQRLTKLDLVQLQALNKARTFSEYMRQSKRALNTVKSDEKGFNDALANAARNGLKPVYEALDRGHFMLADPLDLPPGIPQSTFNKLREYEQPGLYNLYQNHSKFRSKTFKIQDGKLVMSPSSEGVMEGVNDEAKWTQHGLDYLKEIDVPFAKHFPAQIGEVDPRELNVTEGQMNDIVDFVNSGKEGHDNIGMDVELSHFRQLGFVEPGLELPAGKHLPEGPDSLAWNGRLVEDSSLKDTWAARKLFDEFGQDKIRKNALLTVDEKEWINTEGNLCKSDFLKSYRDPKPDCSAATEDQLDLEFMRDEKKLFTFAKLEHLVAEHRHVAL
jgi:hypothetical protein